MKNNIKIYSILALLFLMPVNVSAQSSGCSGWSTYSVADNCDYSSGKCTWNNWGHSNFRTDYKQRSCTSANGRQWFEYTQSTYKFGCC